MPCALTPDKVKLYDKELGQVISFAHRLSSVDARSCALRACYAKFGITEAVASEQCRCPMVEVAGLRASKRSAIEWLERASDVHARRQSIVLDELPARLNQITHQLVEKHIGFVDFL